LHGVLLKIRNLNLTLLSVNRGDMVQPSQRRRCLPADGSLL
jgi:hypothetical protein